MKKVLAILLASALVFTLVACTQSADTSPAPASSAAPASTSSAPSSSAAESTSSAAATFTPGHDTIGEYPDEVDHWARKELKLAYIVYNWAALNQTMTEAYQKWGKVMNFTLTSFSSSTDMEKWFDNLNACSAAGYDGYIFDFDVQATDRVLEVTKELGIKWLTAVNVCKDTAGNMNYPGVSLNSYKLGQQMAQWLNDNYKDYWKDPIDLKTLGLISIGASDLTDFVDRGQGALDKYKELYPDIYSTNSFDIDVAGTGYTADAGYDKVSATISAHPEMTHWFISCCMELQSMGAARAVEALGKNDNCLIICVDGSALMDQWNNGYEGAWVAGLAEPELDHALPTVSGLIALIDGRATPETLWPSHIAQGQKYAEYVLEPKVLTIDNYKQIYGDSTANYESYLAKVPQK
jgi:ABC-type sugar transport system substrate-binding protein